MRKERKHAIKQIKVIAMWFIEKKK